MNEQEKSDHADFIKKVQGEQDMIFGLWKECPTNVKWAWGARAILAYNDRLTCYTIDLLQDRQTGYGSKPGYEEFGKEFNQSRYGLKTICDISVHIATGGTLYDLAQGNCGSSKMQEEDEILEWLAHKSSREMQPGIEDFFSAVYNTEGLASYSDTEYEILKNLYVWPECPSQETRYPKIDKAYEDTVSVPRLGCTIMQPDEGHTFTLWHDGSRKQDPKTFIKANTNASYGYLYLIAYELEGL